MSVDSAHDLAPLDEAAISSLEQAIPQLAQDALRRAYLEALTTSGSVVEAVDGRLVRTHADGSREFIKDLPERPTPALSGTRMVRKRTV